jgi:heptosyltransferase I
MTWATAAPRRIGLADAREGSRNAYTDIIDTSDRLEGHAVDRYWRVAEDLGVGDLPKRFRVPIHSEARTWVERELARMPRPWAVFAVGSRWLTKRWPPEHFATLARYAQSHFGASLIFIGSPDETELADRVMAEAPGCAVNLCGRTNLAQLAACLSLADVVMANDTGPLHLAAALGRPVVAPYTCTKVAKHGPYGMFAAAVETEVWCRGSYLRKCDRLECMSDLQPAKLIGILDRHLSQWRSRASG